MRKFYVRGTDRTPYATVVALDGEDDIRLGMAMMNPDDKWSRSLGTQIAEGRAHKGQFRMPKDSARKLTALSASCLLEEIIGDMCDSRAEEFVLDEILTNTRNGKVLAKTIFLMLE